MKKKILVLVCALLGFAVIGLTGCGSGEESSEEDSSAVEYPIVVEDNENFTFEITDYDDMWSEYKFKVTNKLDKDVTFEAENAVINGDNTVDLFIYCDLAKGTSGKDSFTLNEDQLSDYEKGEEITMSVQYKIIDSTSYEDITTGSFDYAFKKQ